MARARRIWVCLPRTRFIARRTSWARASAGSNWTITTESKTMIAYYLKLYGIALVSFLAIDMFWLGLVARGFYKQHLGYLLSDQPNWAAAIAILSAVHRGTSDFCGRPGVGRRLLAEAGVSGALFGLITYATYDLTNMATVRNWPWDCHGGRSGLGRWCWPRAVSAITFQAGRWLR